MPTLLSINGLLVYGFRGYLCMPDMVEVWPEPDPDDTVFVG